MHIRLMTARITDRLAAAIPVAIALLLQSCTSGAKPSPARAPSLDPDQRPSPISATLPQPKQPEHKEAPGWLKDTRPAGNPDRVKPPDKLAQSNVAVDNSTDWAVIAATYKSFTAAQNRARQLKAVYGDCSCSVYPAEGMGNNYYVVVGGRLTREAADARRGRAVDAGLPVDTYVTKLLSVDGARSRSAQVATPVP